MAEERNRWLFTKEQLQDTPSRADGVDPKKELSYRQQAASLIFDIGQKLNVNQNCVSTAVVFVHRFYMFHSFKKYQRSTISTSALFLACKVEEQPRKLEYVVKVAYSMMNQGKSIDSQSQEFQQMSDEVTVHELLILETLGFDVIVEHPHPYVVKCIQLIRASKDLGQTAYFMAHNSLLMTTMCLEYQPSAVACVCIHLACHWKEIEIPKSSDNKHWWEYINGSVDLDMLNRVADEFLKIYESCPSKIKKKMLNQLKGKQAGGQTSRALQSGGESSSSSSQRPAPSDVQQSASVKPFPPRDKPKAMSQSHPSTTQRQPTATDKPVSVSSAASGSGNKSLAMKTLPLLPPLTISEEKKPSFSVLPPLPRREGDERSRSPRDPTQPDKRSSLAQQRPVLHGHHKNRHGDSHPPPPQHKQKYHDSPSTSSHQLHHHTTLTNQTSAHGGHKRQRNMDAQPHDSKRVKMELPQPPPPPPPQKPTWAELPLVQGQRHLGDPQRPDALQHRLRLEMAKTAASSSSLTVPTAAYSPISPPTPYGVAPPPPPPPLPPSKPPLPPPLPPNSRPM